jgi:hypothetical protein
MPNRRACPKHPESFPPSGCRKHPSASQVLDKPKSVVNGSTDQIGMNVQELQIIVFKDIIGEWAVKNVLVKIRNHLFGVVDQRSGDATTQHIFAKIELHHLRPMGHVPA